MILCMQSFFLCFFGLVYVCFCKSYEVFWYVLFLVFFCFVLGFNFVFVYFLFRFFFLFSFVVVIVVLFNFVMLLLLLLFFLVVYVSHNYYMTETHVTALINLFHCIHSFFIFSSLFFSFFSPSLNSTMILQRFVCLFIYLSVSSFNRIPWQWCLHRSIYIIDRLLAC